MASTGTYAPEADLHVWDQNGLPVNGGLVWTYAAGTSTPIATYTDAALTVPNTNPIVANPDGRFVAFLAPGQAYKFIYETAPVPPASHGSVLATRDNISGIAVSSPSTDIIGTAGETLASGTVVYLSTGAGGRVAGQWYLADADFDYASTLATLVGIAVNTIPTGTQGVIRISGAIPIPGVTLTPGAIYYVSTTAGAVTSTSPANQRIVGQALDTATLAVGMPPPPVVINNSVQNFRLSLSSNVPVTTADVTAATTIYAVPYTGTRMALYDTFTSRWTIYTSGQISIAVPNAANAPYDVFCYANAGVLTLELQGWTNDTTRAVALAQVDGVLVKGSDGTRRYLGSVRTTAVAGQTEDSQRVRYLYNYNNRVRRQLRRVETANTWPYTIATIRQANANALNQIELFQGIAESALDLSLSIGVANNNGALVVGAGIGEDSTTTFSSNQTGPLTLNITVANATITLFVGAARLAIIPTIGRHFYSHNEYSQVQGTTTWWAQDSLGLGPKHGLVGIWES